MSKLTDLPGDIYCIINKLLYSYDNNLKLVNKDINKNNEFIKSYFKIRNNRLLKIKRKYSCLKIQSFIRDYFYIKNYFLNYYIPPANYLNFTENIIPDYSFYNKTRIPDYSFYNKTMIVINNSPELELKLVFDININNNNSSYNENIIKKKKKTKKTKKTKNKIINYKKTAVVKRKNKNIRNNYKFRKNSFRKR